MSASASDSAAAASIQQQAQEYYGQVLQTSSDLKTDACCPGASRPPPRIAKVISQLSDEVVSKYYGCGLTIPSDVEGLSVVDLGSGAGRDCFILSKLVGETGRVIGVDMTESLLDVANRNIEYHTKRFGYATPNVSFVHSLIEDLSAIPSNSVDLVVSNCVLNLSPRKDAVLAEVYRILRDGGEMYFSDMNADRRVPKSFMTDPMLHGEGLSGALYWRDFTALCHKTGFPDVRIVNSRPLEVHSDELAAKVAPIDYYAVTYRLFKLPGLDAGREDYGQAVSYRGTSEDAPLRFSLSADETFARGKVEAVDRNTYRMLKETRLAKHFEFYGVDDTTDAPHFGPFGGNSCNDNGVPFESCGGGGGGGCC